MQLKNVKVTRFKDGYTAMVLITDPYFSIIENNKAVEKKLFFGLALQARIYIEKKKLLEYLIQ